MTGSAIISEDKKYRYRLDRVWNPSTPLLMWMMLNPSTADADRNDPTIKKCIMYSINEGFGGFVVHNLFPFRATYECDLFAAGIDAREAVGQKANYDGYILRDAKLCGKICCAWGTVRMAYLPRVEEVKKLLKPFDLCYLRMNNSGEPAHPLYLPSKLRLQPWSQECSSS